MKALRVLLPLVLVLVSGIGRAQQYSWASLAGKSGGYGTVDGVGNAARFSNPHALAFDAGGNMLVADWGNCSIRKISPSGMVTTLAGLSGVVGNADGTGSAARFFQPDGLAVDASGNVFVADAQNCTIRKITPEGVVSTFAGTAGNRGYADGTGSTAIFSNPTGLAFDADGDLFVADSNNNVIRKITTAGVVTTVAGDPNFAGTADGTGAAARFWQPSGIVLDASGVLVIADYANHSIRKMTPAGEVTTFVGTPGVNGSADGTGTEASLTGPIGLALDASGNLYIAERDNQAIRKVTPAGVVTTLAGSPGINGTVDGTGADARLNYPVGIAVDANGDVYVGDEGSSAIRKVTQAGVVTTPYGSVTHNGTTDGTGSDARFQNPAAIAVDASGVAYVADTFNHSIRKVLPTGEVSTFAGSPGVEGNTDGTGTDARFSFPNAVALDGAGNLFVSDFNNSTIRKITPGGVVTTFAGIVGSGGLTDGAAGEGQLFGVGAIGFGQSGDLYVVETFPGVIRKVSPSGTVTTVAGSPFAFGSADGTGSDAQFNQPSGVTSDGAGGVFVADNANNTVRRVSASGVVTTYLGVAGSYGSVDGPRATAQFGFPWALATDSAGRLFVFDSGNNTVRMVTAAGIVSTIGGTPGVVGGADGIGPDAQFCQLVNIAIGPAGKVYLLENLNNQVVVGTPLIHDPIIAVEQPVGTELTNGLASTDFGTVAVGTSKVITYTVRNKGTGDLTGLAVTKSGPNAADFTIGTLGATTLAPASTTTFTVTFSPAARGNRRALVQIASNDPTNNPFSVAVFSGYATDTTGPNLAVSSPSATTTALSTLAPYTVTGSTSDGSGVARVAVSLNGSPLGNATLDSTSLATSAHFTLPITPLIGSNTLGITSYDTKGNSTTVTRTFTFTQRFTLSVNRSVPDGVALDTAGVVALAATPSTDASGLTPSTANTNKTATVVPGTTIKLTAAPRAGYVFSSWTDLPSGAVVLGNVVTFAMPGDDASATAIFVVNPFIAEAGAGAGFYGLIHPGVGTPSNNATEGFISGTLVARTGVFTGRVSIDGAVQGIVATFYGDGSSLFTVGGVKQSSLSFGDKTLTLGFASGNINATVVGGANTSTGVATRAAYSSTNTVPVSLLNTASVAGGPINRGSFTITFPAKTQVPAKDVTTYPQGVGFGTLTISETGAVSLAGTLADGTSVSGSSALVAGNTCPIFVQLVTPGAASTVKGGSFGGVLTFDVNQESSDVTGTNLLWIRPVVTEVTSPAAAVIATSLYTDGWPNGVRVDALGALYYKDVDVQSALALGAVDLVNGNGLLRFAHAKLTADVLVTAFNIAPGATAGTSPVTKIPVRNTTFTLAVTQASGAMVGSFTPNWSTPNPTKPTFRGVLLQKGSSKGGYGYFLSNAVGDANPESGSVNLSARPPSS